MNRKRVWEIGAGVVLLLLLVVTGGGLLYHKSLNDRLIPAVVDADTAAVKSLLARGANPNATDARFQRVLAIAESKEAAVSQARKKQLEVVMAVSVEAALQRHTRRGYSVPVLRERQLLVKRKVAQVRRRFQQAYAKIPNPYTPVARLLRQHGATK